MLHIADLLTPQELADIRVRIAACPWVDGRATAGHLSAAVKHNRQLAEDDPAAQAAAAIVLQALGRNTIFAAAALPMQIAPPLFNRYGPGEHYGDHVDNAIRPIAGKAMRLDLSATLFLSDPEAYQGGELVLHSSAGAQAFKLKAGDMLLYETGAIHHVAPVLAGQRDGCFFWVQSLVPDASCREMLFDLDASIAALRSKPDHEQPVLKLTALYHNLLRRWVRL